MQTELMTRLLKGNKIVGYKWTLPVSKVKEIINLKWIHLIPEHYDFLKKKLISLYSPDLVNWYLSFGFWNKTTENIEPDFFELGTIVDDKRSFEGDIIKIPRHFDYFNKVFVDSFIGILNFKMYEFVISNKDNEIDLRFAVLLDKLENKKLELIGNVHDNPEFMR